MCGEGELERDSLCVCVYVGKFVCGGKYVCACEGMRECVCVCVHVPLCLFMHIYLIACFSMSSCVQNRVDMYVFQCVHV